MRTPLNGTKTHPLSAHALTVLERIGEREQPCFTINPGVINRLMRDDLVTIFQAPYGKQKSINYLRITEAGRAALSPSPASTPEE